MPQRASVSSKERKEGRLRAAPPNYFVCPANWRKKGDGSGDYEELKYVDDALNSDWRDKDTMVPTGTSCTEAAMLTAFRTKPPPLFGTGLAKTLASPLAL